MATNGKIYTGYAIRLVINVLFMIVPKRMVSQTLNTSNTERI